MKKIDFSAQLNARRWLPIAGLLAAIFVCIIVYWPGLNGPMLYDDFPQLGRFFQPGTAEHAFPLDQVLWSNSGPLGRPVSMFTFWVNSVLTPDNLAAWKLTNLVIHILCGLLAGLLAMELFVIAGRERGIEPRYLGAFIGIVWLLHPLQVSTVLYTVQRMTQLSVLFVFTGLYVYVLARRNASATIRQAMLSLAGLGIATALATFSKEDGLLLPFLALAVEITVFRWRATPGVSRLLKYFFGGLCALTAVAITLALILRPQILIGNYASRAFTLGQRLLSEPRILFDYLSMLLLPIPGSMGFFHDDFVLSSGLLHPLTTLWSWLGLVVLAVSAWFARKRLPLYALGVAIFLIGQSMESSFIALEPMFEHRNYLPCFGIFLSITDIAAWLLTKRTPVLRSTLAGLVLLGLTVLLAVRVMHWSSSLNLYTAAVSAHPDSDGAISGLAQVYLDAGNPELALQALATHTSFGAQLQRAYIECKMDGSLPDSLLEGLASQPMRYLNSYPVTGLTMLGALGIQNRCRFSDAIYSRLIDRASQLDTTSHGLRYMLYIYSGYYHQRLQQLEPAVAAMQAAHHMSPATPVPLILSARWYLKAGDPVQAGARLQQALQIDNQYHAGFADDIAQLEAQIETTTDSPAGARPR